jgi:hypothetical protein
MFLVTGGFYTWGIKGSYDSDVHTIAVEKPLTAKLTIKDTTWYRHLVQLHKAKGGQLFKIYAAVLAVSLFVILFSGFIMAWQVPKYRRRALVFSAAGVGMFLLMINTS